MSKIKTFEEKINYISEWTGDKAKWLMIPLTGIVFLEVILRYVFNAPSTWAYELTEYMFGAVSMIGAAYCMRFNLHVRMDLISSRLSMRMQAILNVCTSFFIFYFSGMLIYKGWEYAWPTLMTLERSGTVWNPPYWPYALVLPISASLLFLEALSQFLNSFLKIVKRREDN